jgi:hypothetical protein
VLETKHTNAIIMRTVMIPSEAKHSNAILWEQLWYPRKQSNAISYYENSYDTLGNKAQRYHTMRSVMIPVLCFRGYHNCSHSMALLCFVSEGIITVLIVWYCCALFSRVSTIIWEQLWFPRKQSTAIQYYENSYDTLGNTAQQYHTMITVMIPSETKDSDTILRVS